MKRVQKYINLQDFLKTLPEEEKKLVDFPCRNGRNCNKEGCVFLHNLKTRMCKFAQTCRRGNNCSFAHSEKELYIPACKFGLSCKKPQCTFKHPEPPKPVIEIKKDKSLNLEIHNFPNDLNIQVDTDSEIKNYSEMKNIITYQENVIIEAGASSIEDIIEKYNCVLDFTNLKINF